MKCTHIFSLLLLGAVLCFPGNSASPVSECRSEWSDSLCLGGGGRWNKRIPIQIRNDSGKELKGESVSLKIGSAGLPVQGMRAEELRLVDENGSELIFDLERNGKKARKGILEEGTVLYFPAVCKNGKTARATLYFDNPDAFLPAGWFWKRVPAPDGVSVTSGKTQELEIRMEKDSTVSGVTGFQACYPVSVRNFSGEAKNDVLVYLELNEHPLDLIKSSEYKLVFNGKEVRFLKIGSGILFRSSLPAKTERIYSLFLKKNPERLKITGSLKHSSDILSDSSFKRVYESVDRGTYAELMNSKANLAPNCSFEKGAKNQADGWPANIENRNKKGAVLETVGDAVYGKRAIRVNKAKNSKAVWPGWRATIPVKAGSSYIFTSWIKGENVLDSNARDIYMHLRNEATGEIRYIDGIGSIQGTFDWRPALLSVTVPQAPGKWRVKANLVSNSPGITTYDGVIFAETLRSRIGKPEKLPAETAGWKAWQVNPIVKVFPDVFPPETISPVRVSAAKNESEPLQLVFRNRKPDAGMAEISAPSPVNRNGETLPEPKIEIVGFVPVDYPGQYYGIQVPPWQRALPLGTGTGDGVLWPDPLLPSHTFAPSAKKSQPVWLTFRVPENASPGRYYGNVVLSQNGKQQISVPYELDVYDFTLPEKRSMGGLFDLRIYGSDEGKNIWGDTVTERKRSIERISRFLMERKLGGTMPGYSRIVQKYDREKQKLDINFSYFDRDQGPALDGPESVFTYIIPSTRFVFGLPPFHYLGVPPYNGKYPYKGIDRAAFTPEFKKVLTESTKRIWEHIKTKGWQEKAYYYLADEPSSDPEIIRQGAAMLDILRAAAPGMKIYSSTWRDIPEWHGKLNVWGIGVSGSMAVEQMKARQKAGDELIFTMDGHMCLDTPFNAIERLLPYFCYKYGIGKYEFWGVCAVQHNQLDYGFPRFNISNPAPGVYRSTRYPNGDGYLLYPGKYIGYDGLISSVRLENCRDGIDDYDYLMLLDELVRKTGDKDGEKTLEKAKRIVSIPNPGGRNSIALLPDPDKIPAIREEIARQIERIRRNMKM